MPVPLPDELLDLLGRPSLCFVATIMPDGSPQLTQTWVSTDGEHILINTPDHSQKARNVARDPARGGERRRSRQHQALLRGARPRYRDNDRGWRAEHRRDFRQVPRPTVSELQRTPPDADDHDDRGQLRPRYGRVSGMPCPPPLNSPLWSLRFVDVERPVPVRRLIAPGTLMRTSSPLAERAVVARFRETSVHRSTWSACMRWPAFRGVGGRRRSAGRCALVRILTGRGKRLDWAHRPR